MMVYACAMLLLLAVSATFAIPSLAQAQVTWGGYLQTRFSTDYRSSTGFSIRRAKLYTTSTAPFDTNLSARMQAMFRWQYGGAFTLQDVYAEYRLPYLSFRMGQFVPEFSLQRLQPDATLPVVERALVVDALVPSTETYARDVGAQVAVHPLPQFQVTLGAFNGNGGNQSGNNDRRLLFVARSTAHSSFSDSVDLYVGLSFAYRDKDGMTLKKICGTLVPFWGKDARWGGEGRLSSSVWSVQAEYIEAHLEAEKTLGYYVLGSVFIDETNEMTGLVEQFRDIDPNTSDAAWYSAGWNHYFSGSEEPKLATARTGDSVQDSSEN